LETNKRIEPVHERLDMMLSNTTRFKTEVEQLTANHEQMQGNMKSWLEQVQSGEYQRKKQMEAWAREMEEIKSVLEKYDRDWIPISDQFQEAKMALQSLSTWQQQQEQLQRETAELLRVESHRLQARWENFRLENDKKWQTFEMDAGQRNQAVDRRERVLQDQIVTLETLISELEKEKETLKRVQTAQAEAIKKVPLIWMEAVENAVNQDPERRRQPALVTVREE
jgi:chromosome segregation ATPase